MTHSAHEHLRGRYVKFHLRDIHLPEPAVILQQLHGGDILQGRVVDFSDSGEEASAFVVIEVDGLHQPCILAAHLVKPAEPS
jgi:hypothetical protein